MRKSNCVFGCRAAMMVTAFLGYGVPGALASSISSEDEGNKTKLPVVTSVSFIADHTGDVLAYFAGSAEDYKYMPELLINGVQATKYSEGSDSSFRVGHLFTLGHATAGDHLTFELYISRSGKDVGPFNSVSSKEYSGELGHGIPKGMLVSFEKIRAGKSESSGHEDFVLTNVGVIRSPVVTPPVITPEVIPPVISPSVDPPGPTAHAVPEPSTMGLIGLGGIALAISKFARRRKQSHQSAQIES